MTLALVMLTYAIAHALHASGPLAVVVAGLFIGNAGTRFAMSGKTREHVHTFWQLIDEILNAVLFLLIGLEVVTISLRSEYLWAALAAICLVLAARYISVALPIGLLRLRREFIPGTVSMLTWGGLRGGISVALALSLPAQWEIKELILAVTYAVVIFSIVVQGTTVGHVARRALRGAARPESSAT
jgi:CPA1 family monovalent cation:H+ antiporter